MKKRISVAVILVLTVILSFSVFTGCAGKSAYEIACENGFSGTEQEWLESLKGSDGQSAEIDIYALYDAYLDEYPDATFADFLSSFEVGGNSTEYAVSVGVQSTVSIFTMFSKKVTVRPGQTSSSDYSAGGSGVVYRTGGGFTYIITNYHVVYDRDSNNTENCMAKKIEIYSYGYEYVGKTVEAEFVGGSMTKDIAVIKAASAAFSGGIKAAQAADSNDLTLGETVIAVGNPLGEGISVSSGIISVDSEEIAMEALDSASKTNTMRVIRTDTPINGGNSGGGLFNRKGELLGIVNAKTVEDGVENMGYAIPVSVAAGIADCVIENDSKKCTLGITVSASSARTQYNAPKNRVEIIETVAVESVSSGTLAAGKLQEGDILLSVRLNNGQESGITRYFHLSDYLYKTRAGDTVNLTILRGSTTLTVGLTPGFANFSLV